MILCRLIFLNLFIDLILFDHVKASRKVPGSSSRFSNLSTDVTRTQAIKYSVEDDEIIDSGSDNSLRNRPAPVSPGIKRKHSSNTLLINRQFHEEWRNLLIRIEVLILKQITATNRIMTNFRRSISAFGVQSLLVKAIEANDRGWVIYSISNGAKFLSNGVLSRLGSGDYVPIETAVVLDSVHALEGMLQFLRSIPSHSNVILFGGLLIRAVQAGHLRTVKLLVEKYKACYLKGSYLFQKAIMHKVPVNVLKYIFSTFHKELEMFQSFGRHQDFPLHLAVKYTNEPAFKYLFQ